MICVNLARPQGAQTFGETLFYVLQTYVDEINMWVKRLSKADSLP